ncbi:MAG: oligosaccharide flippase family protein [Sulfurimonas sp.]|nr:oligosaccharide flippase family protein [Sulfurimonas sp.]
MGIPFLLLPYMVLKLGSDLYGLWILFTTIISYLGLSGFGFGTTFLKEVSKNINKYNLNKYLNTTIGFYILICIFLVPLLIFLYFNLDTLFLINKLVVEEAQISFVLFIITFIVNFLSSLFSSLLFAKNFLNLQNYVSIVASLISAILIYLTLYYDYSIIALSLINLLVSIFSSIVILYITKKKVRFKISRKYFDFNLLKEMFVPSLHYFIITASAMIILYSDNIIISSYIGLEGLAIYSIGYKLVSISQIFLFKIVDIMIPDISILYETKEYLKLLKLHNKVFLVSILLAAFGYGILYFYGIDFLNWWVGKDFVIDKSIFNLFIYFAMIHSGIHVSAIFLVAMGEHKGTSYMTMIDALLNIILSIILLKSYGLLGVALGTLIAHSLTSAWFTTWWFYKKVKNKQLEHN